MKNDDIVLNENRHLLYNLLDNYYYIGNKFWDNPLHTMLVSCTFGLISIEMYNREILEYSHTIRGMEDFINIPNLTIIPTNPVTLVNRYYNLNFYYKDKFFAHIGVSEKVSYFGLRDFTEKFSYHILFDEYNPNKLLYTGTLTISVPTSYSYNKFNTYHIQKILNNNQIRNISKTFLELYGQCLTIFSKITDFPNHNDENIASSDEHFELWGSEPVKEFLDTYEKDFKDIEDCMEKINLLTKSLKGKLDDLESIDN